MKIRTTIALTAMALLAGVTAGSAAEVASSHGGMAMKASDTLNLDATQQKTAWRDLNTPALNQTAPSGFDATVGAVVPAGVTVASMPSKAARDIPTLRPYDFAMVQHKVVIVNPTDKKIAEVISG